MGWRLVTCLALLVVLTCPAQAAEAPAKTSDDFDIQDLNDYPRKRDIQYPDWFKLSFLDLPEDLGEAVDAGKKGIIVYFGQKHCAYCEALMEVNFAKEDIVHYTREHFDVIPINIWGSRTVTDMQGRQLTEREFAVRENTNFTPSLIFYDSEGNQALRLRGYYKPYRFRAALEYVVDGYYRKESLRDYLARADPPPKFELGDLNDRAFFEDPPYALDRSRFEADRPLVVFFEQHNCHACDILHTDTLWDAPTRQLLEEFQVVQLDMWSDAPVLTPDGERMTAEEWAQDLDIFYAPTLVFFDQQGEEIIRVESVVRMYRLRGVLEYVAEKGYEKAPTFQRWREDYADAGEDSGDEAG